MVGQRVRLFIAALFATVLVGGLAGAAVPTAHHNWNCREISLSLFAKTKTGRTICYPCPPDLPAGTPGPVVSLWNDELCAPAA